MFSIFDSHFHIIDPQFPLVKSKGYQPANFTCKDYLHRTKHLQIAGEMLVSASFQGFDQTYLEAALKILGPSFFAVTQLPATVTDEEILSLHALGVRGVRFNLEKGGSEKVENMGPFAKRIHELAGWHIDLYVDAKDLAELSPTLRSLPAVSIDHLGLSQKGLPVLLSLVEKGIKVKASGFGRVDFDVADALKELAKANPNALMFGTDLPSPRAPRPFLDEDIQLIRDTFDDTLSEKVLYSNAVNFYS